jgi:hypothetical protein
MLTNDHEGGLCHQINRSQNTLRSLDIHFSTQLYKARTNIRCVADYLRIVETARTIHLESSILFNGLKSIDKIEQYEKRVDLIPTKRDSG